MLLESGGRTMQSFFLSLDTVGCLATFPAFPPFFWPSWFCSTPIVQDPFKAHTLQIGNLSVSKLAVLGGVLFLFALFVLRIGEKETRE